MRHGTFARLARFPMLFQFVSMLSYFNFAPVDHRIRVDRTATTMLLAMQRRRRSDSRRNGCGCCSNRPTRLHTTTVLSLFFLGFENRRGHIIIRHIIDRTLINRHDTMRQSCDCIRSCRRSSTSSFTLAFSCATRCRRPHRQRQHHRQHRRRRRRIEPLLLLATSRTRSHERWRRFRAMRFAMHC